MLTNGAFERLIDITQLLAAPAEQQLQAFPSFVVAADELALNFSEALAVVRQETARSAQTRLILGLAENIDEITEHMSSMRNPSLWTPDALRALPEWQSIRVLAGRLLDAAGRERRPAPLTWVRYVPGGNSDARPY